MGCVGLDVKLALLRFSYGSLAASARNVVVLNDFMWVVDEFWNATLTDCSNYCNSIAFPLELATIYVRRNVTSNLVLRSGDGSVVFDSSSSLDSSCVICMRHWYLAIHDVEDALFLHHLLRKDLAKFAALVILESVVALVHLLLDDLDGVLAKVVLLLVYFNIVEVLRALLVTQLWLVCAVIS